ncbi:AurF N-oxygenase family protein [Actinomadura harenae]|uniref:Diiron oxygenase n=1 Tax=Actinomadura harenae TaxID=2483351 RepID=A0A3M2LND7_9ACTN|nr:diiron oxygenase [Actinomadura harenae]RMI38053.1 diiron oxygenase [Actinomadura harenae]
MTTTLVRCADGDHTVELRDRERVAERLIKASTKKSYNPEVDVDWDAPLDPDLFYLPPETLSLYETPLWDRMTHEQRVELSRHELVSMLSFGIWSELMLMKGLLGHVYRGDPTSRHIAYALTETADECRHSTMFGRFIGKTGLRPYRMAWPEFQLGKLAGFIDPPMAMFAAVLLVEEVTDAVQRVTMTDERVQPLVRTISRIHVAEEARHISYAREELKRQVASTPRPLRRAQASGIAGVGFRMAPRLTRPAVYGAVGLDPRTAYRVAKSSAHRQATLRWAFRRATGFLTDIGMIEGPSARIWHRTGMLSTPETPVPSSLPHR